MSESLKILNNIRTLRAQSREFSLENLEEMLEKLTTVVEDRRQEEVAFLEAGRFCYLIFEEYFIKKSR